jgi:hypothetical protein
MVRNKKYIIVFGCLLLSVLAIGQRKNDIILHADSSDKYILVYRTDNFNILIGYNAFAKSKILDSEYIKGSTLRYIDSMKKYRNTIYLNSDSICSDSTMIHDIAYWSLLTDVFQETQSVIANLIDSGNVRIYNCDTKRYLNRVIRRKEKWRSRESWGYGHESRKGESWFYRDYESHRMVFQSLIYMKGMIKERLPR